MITDNELFDLEALLMILMQNKDGIRPEIAKILRTIRSMRTARKREADREEIDSSPT